MTQVASDLGIAGDETGPDVERLQLFRKVVHELVDRSDGRQPLRDAPELRQVSLHLAQALALLEPEHLGQERQRLREARLQEGNVVRVSRRGQKLALERGQEGLPFGGFDPPGDLLVQSLLEEIQEGPRTGLLDECPQVSADDFMRPIG